MFGILSYVGYEINRVRCTRSVLEAFGWIVCLTQTPLLQMLFVISILLLAPVLAAAILYFFWIAEDELDKLKNEVLNENRPEPAPPQPELTQENSIDHISAELIAKKIVQLLLKLGESSFIDAVGELIKNLPTTQPQQDQTQLIDSMVHELSKRLLALQLREEQEEITKSQKISEEGKGTHTSTTSRFAPLIPIQTRQGNVTPPQRQPRLSEGRAWSTPLWKPTTTIRRKAYLASQQRLSQTTDHTTHQQVDYIGLPVNPVEIDTVSEDIAHIKSTKLDVTPTEKNESVFTDFAITSNNAHTASTIEDKSKTIRTEINTVNETEIIYTEDDVPNAGEDGGSDKVDEITAEDIQFNDNRTIDVEVTSVKADHITTGTIKVVRFKIGEFGNTKTKSRRARMPFTVQKSRSKKLKSRKDRRGRAPATKSNKSNKSDRSLPELGTAAAEPPESGKSNKLVADMDQGVLPEQLSSIEAELQVQEGRLEAPSSDQFDDMLFDLYGPNDFDVLFEEMLQDVGIPPDPAFDDMVDLQPATEQAPALSLEVEQYLASETPVEDCSRTKSGESLVADIEMGDAEPKEPELRGMSIWGLQPESVVESVQAQADELEEVLGISPAEAETTQLQEAIEAPSVEPSIEQAAEVQDDEPEKTSDTQLIDEWRLDDRAESPSESLLESVSTQTSSSSFTFYTKEDCETMLGLIAEASISTGQDRPEDYQVLRQHHDYLQTKIKEGMAYYRPVYAELKEILIAYRSPALAPDIAYKSQFRLVRRKFVDKYNEMKGSTVDHVKCNSDYHQEAIEIRRQKLQKTKDDYRNIVTSLRIGGTRYTMDGYLQQLQTIYRILTEDTEVDPRVEVHSYPDCFEEETAGQKTIKAPIIDCEDQFDEAEIMLCRRRILMGGFRDCDDPNHVILVNQMDKDMGKLRARMDRTESRLKSHKVDPVFEKQEIANIIKCIYELDFERTMEHMNPQCNVSESQLGIIDPDAEKSDAEKSGTDTDSEAETNVLSQALSYEDDLFNEMIDDNDLEQQFATESRQTSDDIRVTQSGRGGRVKPAKRKANEGDGIQILNRNIAARKIIPYSKLKVAAPSDLGPPPPPPMIGGEHDSAHQKDEEEVPFIQTFPAPSFRAAERELEIARRMDSEEFHLLWTRLWSALHKDLPEEKKEKLNPMREFAQSLRFQFLNLPRLDMGDGAAVIRKLKEIVADLQLQLHLGLSESQREYVEQEVGKEVGLSCRLHGGIF